MILAALFLYAEWCMFQDDLLKEIINSLLSNNIYMFAKIQIVGFKYRTNTRKADT